MKTMNEAQLAETIVSALPTGVVRACSSDRSAIRYSVRAEGLKLHTIVLNRASLRRLLADSARDVKVDYLRRDLAESARARSEYRYPRLHLHPRPDAAKLRFGLGIASIV